MAIKLEVTKIDVLHGVIICELDVEDGEPPLVVDIPIPIDDEGNAIVSTPAELRSYMADHVKDTVLRKEKVGRTKPDALTWLAENVEAKVFDITGEIAGRR